MKQAFQSRASAWAIALLTIALAAFVGISTAHAAVTTTLSPGDNNPQVVELQSFLSTDTSVYPEGLVTGFYGDLTTAAVERFQCKYDIVCSGSPETTGYGRVGPVTLAKIQNLQGTGGSGVSGDVSAPIIYYSSIAVTPTSNGASLVWTTSEASRSRVMYGSYWPFLYATAPSFADPSFNSTSALVMTGLLPNTTYYYTLESVDASGNLQWTSERSFKTTN